MGTMYGAGFDDELIPGVSEWPWYRPEKPISIEDLTEEGLEWEATYPCSLAKACRPVPLEMHKRHFMYFFGRDYIVKQVSEVVFNGISLETALMIRTRVKVEKRMCESINAISDERLEELWEMAQMDFVLEKMFSDRMFNEARGNIFKFFWCHYIADLPSEQDYPELKAPPLIPVSYATSAARQLDYKIWPAACKEWVKRQNYYRFATNVPGKVPGLN